MSKSQAFNLVTKDVRRLEIAFAPQSLDFCLSHCISKLLKRTYPAGMETFICFLQETTPCPQWPYTEMVGQEMNLISPHLCITVSAQPSLLTRFSFTGPSFLLPQKCKYVLGPGFSFTIRFPHKSYAQLCPPLCDPKDSSPSGSSVHVIFQARILKWLPLPTPGDLPNLGIKHVSCISCIGRQILCPQCYLGNPINPMADQYYVYLPSIPTPLLQPKKFDFLKIYPHSYLFAGFV